MKYGLYYFKNTHNIGDDVWAYAQSLFYPRIDYLIDNTTAYNFKPENNEKVATIIGAFVEPYNYEYAFLLPNCVVPLFAGTYFRPTMRELLDNGAVKKWLSEYAPIGCRTKKIADDFNSTGIDAYFSGCISLTLPNLKIRKQQYICLVDVPNYVADYVKQKVGDKFEIKTLSHTVVDIAGRSALDITERFQIVQNLIDIYAAAHCVITSRLHVALPCLTQNTSVLFVVPDEPAIGVNDIHVRVQDYFDLVHHNFNSDFINGNIDYDFVNPPLNSNKYLSYKNNLRKVCTDFINRCETGDISTPQALADDDKIQILQDKIVQLKCVVDGKNTLLHSKNNAILTLQQRLRQYENFNAWENIEYFGDWEGRSRLMSKFVNEQTKTLLDLGCGEMHIRKFLEPNTIYHGCDYIKRDNNTIIADLSVGEFPDIYVDTIFIAGLLEYLSNWQEVLEKCSQYCSQIVMSYSTVELNKNRNAIWVNALSRIQIINLLKTFGFGLLATDEYNGSEIFNFGKEVENNVA